MKISPYRSTSGLFILLAIFLLGFCLLIVQHNLFLRLQDRLELQTENEHNRIVIGEMIINDLRQLEANFLRLPATTDPESRAIFAEAILRAVAQVRQSLDVIEKGGTIEFHIPLNLPEQDEMVTTVHYQPTSGERYILEIIDLRPRLADIEKKAEILSKLTAARDRITEDHSNAQWIAAANELKYFLKNTSPIFIRMNENANLLFYNSRERLASFERIAAEKQQKFRMLEAIVASCTIVVVLLLVVFVYRRQADIVELQQSKEALSAAFRRFSSILDGLDNIIYVADLHTCEILFINRYTLEKFGNIVGRKCFQVFRADGREEICPCCRNRHLQLDRHNGCFTWEREDHGTYYEIHGQLINWEDDRKAIHILVIDITDRKIAQLERQEVEARLHRAQKMEAIGMMAGGVAHDLNNILAGIVTYPDMLLLDQPPDSPMHKPLNIIKQAGKRAAAIVDDLLTVARGIAQKKEAVDLNTIIEQYLQSPEFAQLSARFPAVSFTTETADNLALFSGSAIHIAKVLMNLVTNAAEAIEGQGTVHIATANVPLPPQATPPRVMLRISDNGPGIKKEDLERIFEPFYSKKVMGRSGTGLGLAVVWNVVREHGGTVEVASNSAGTAFEIQFPAGTEKNLTMLDSKPEELLIGNGEKILVIDDDEQQREIAASMLTRLGYEPQTVTSGEEAVSAIGKQSFALLLLDMIMPPGIGGRETYEQILTIRPDQKAILVSGFSASDEVQQAIKLGASSFLRKPYTVQELAAAIKEALPPGA